MGDRRLETSRLMFGLYYLTSPTRHLDTDLIDRSRSAEKPQTQPEMCCTTEHTKVVIFSKKSSNQSITFSPSDNSLHVLISLKICRLSAYIFLTIFTI